MSNKRFSTWAAAAAFLLAAFQAHAILPIQQWDAGTGARVYFVENHDLPMLDVSVEFPAGAGYDTKDKSGAANMTNHLLRLGAGGMSEDEIARGLADVGALLSSRFDTDRGGLAVRTLSNEPQRKQALDIFARVLQHPEFPEDVLGREKIRLISALKEADTKPETIASLTFYRLVYRDHPYALRASGEVETVNRLTREDLADFYRRHYVAKQAVVAIIGDLSREEAAAIAETVTADLPRNSAAELSLPPVSALAAGSTRIIAHPASQSHILIGAPGMRRGDPDYFPLYVGNYVLGGGGFVSRITEEVRNKRGLAYSAYSYFSPLERRGPFLIGLQTKREQAQEALSVVQETLRQFLANGPTDQELKAAKQNIIGSFPLRIDSNRKILEYLALIGFYRLPLTYLEDFGKNVARVTVADVKSAFARRIDANKLVTVVVGAGENKVAPPAGGS